MNQISVLQISPFFSPNVGGVETHLDDLLKLAGKRKIKNTVIAYQPLVGNSKGENFERRSHTVIYRIGWLRNIFYKTAKYPFLHFFYLTPYLALRILIFMMKESESIDVMHAHGINAAVVGLFMKRLFRKPLIVSLHNELNLSLNSLSTKFILLVLKHTEYVLVLTEKSKNYLNDMGIDQEKIKIYSYWVNQKTFKPKDKDVLRSMLKWDKKFTVLFVGRLIEEKGIKLLLEAAKKMPEIKFVLAGSGPLEDEIKQSSKAFKNIVYLGRISNKDLVPYYCASDILVVPSLVRKSRIEYEEGNPRVIIEALSCGIPVIATNNGGTKELIIKSKAGKIFDSNTDSLISAIKSMHYSKFFKQCKRSARSYALTSFGENNGVRILKFYEKLKKKRIMEARLKTLLRNVGDMALKRRAQAVIFALDIEDRKRFLDIGCGDGFYLHILSNLGIELNLIGIDYDDKALASARSNLINKRLSLVKSDLMKKLPFDSNSIDAVVMSEVAEHLQDDLKGLKEAYRVLKPNGRIALTVPCRNYPFLWDPINWILEHLFNIHIKNGFWAGIWNQHIRLYSQSQINSVLRSAGFKILESQVQTFWCLPFNHHLVNLGARMLVNGNLSKSIRDSANKFSTSEAKSFNLAKIFFFVINIIDKLNIILPIRLSGVSIFVKAIK